MQHLTLHQYHPSGNCYKIRLTAAILDIDLKLKDYDLMKGESRTEQFLSNISANGSCPVLQIGADTFLPESNAATYYVATGSNLIPTDRLQHAEVLRWMFFEQYQIEPNIGSLRFWTRRIGLQNLDDYKKSQIEAKKKAAVIALGVMEQHLAKREYFVGDALTIADIALYAYTHVAAQAGFELAGWPNVQRWCERVTQQPNYVPIGDERWD